MYDLGTKQVDIGGTMHSVAARYDSSADALLVSLDGGPFATCALIEYIGEKADLVDACATDPSGVVVGPGIEPDTILVSHGGSALAAFTAPGAQPAPAPTDPTLLGPVAVRLVTGQTPLHVDFGFSPRAARVSRHGQPVEYAVAVGGVDIPSPPTGPVMGDYLVEAWP